MWEQKFPLVTLRELMFVGTEFPVTAALMADLLLVAVELQLLIGMAVAKGQPLNWVKNSRNPQAGIRQT